MIEGIAPYMQPDREIKPVEEVELLAKGLQERTGLKIEHSDKLSAYYSPSQHLVQMPGMKYFKDDLAYARTAAHEFVHSTGPALRRKQDGGFGSVSYAKEELVAELGSVFLGHALGIGYEASAHENHAAYMRSWLKVLNDDKEFIAKAASMAGKAVDYQMEHLHAYKADLELKQELAEQLQAHLPKSEQKKNHSVLKI